MQIAGLQVGAKISKDKAAIDADNMIEAFRIAEKEQALRANMDLEGAKLGVKIGGMVESANKENKKGGK
jgi:hypothetical protein